MPITINPSQEVNNPVDLEKDNEFSFSSSENTQEVVEESVAQEPILDGIVNITDPKAPLVILYGPTSCGKTMTLIRLTKHLRNKYHCTVTPDRTFRPAKDKAYQEDCDKFNQTVNDPIAAHGTSGYMLVDVVYQGRTLCKILEAPGEYYFDPKNPKKKYPHYLSKIIAAPNRKVWCAFVEPNWMDPNNRADYRDRIKDLKPTMTPTDQMVFVFNKIDTTGYVIKPGVVNEKEAVNRISQLYQGIFDEFRNDIPILKWFQPYTCMFVPFQTGIFSDGEDADGNQITLYAEGNEAYPERLWKVIKKSI